MQQSNHRTCKRLVCDCLQNSFFFFCKKDVYSKIAKCKVAQSISKSTKKREKSKNIKEALITKKERAKEQRERNCLQNSKNLFSLV